ncbi:MAG: efflux RND transporter permease subunit [Akkermansiaceae bacterium]|nr:efflux RND transporter permease subunit [Akkermansiaceae bacterium]MCP5542472.1 efflux RND transporter permease subunit [Akkermansiaceae bacterium]MCP5545993.1 efflux RND transporter permease subunit [Akkermansiaceae bacterium]
MIRWFARNDIAANFLILSILLWGGYSAMERVPLEVQPAIKFNQVDINVPYRGGSPQDVERAVLIPIESALEGLKGVERIESEARSGSGRVRVIAHESGNPKELMEEVKTRVDRITTFPQEIEPPRIQIPDSDMWFDVIKIAVTGDMDEVDLLKAARRVRDDLIEMRGISQANVQGASPMEISIEADPMRLRDYGLTFSDLTAAIQRSSLDLPAGEIQTDEGSLMIRSQGQAYVRSDFENIVIRNEAGAEVSLAKVARVVDGFEENRKIMRFNGTPCLLVEALRLGNENALDIAALVKNYAATASARFPEGITLHIWDDSSEELEGRLGTLLGSLLQGSLLVLVVLGLFLRPGIAFWVTLGIPVSFAGGFILMPYFGITANVMSIFGFIIVVGIIVDDAIVTAENVYIKLRDGVPPLDAATEGTKEVAVPVTFGALTTIVAFVPLLFFEGFYGSFTKQIPPVVTAVLIFSLIESKLCLPCHLKHVRVHRKRFNRFERFQKFIADGLEAFVSKVYEPALRFSLKHRYITLAGFLAAGMAATGYIESGALGFVNMPSIDRNRIVAQVRMPRDTPVEVTDERVKTVESAVAELRREFVDPGTGESLISDALTSSGGWSGHPGVDPRTGFVTISVLDPGFRSEPGPKNSEIAKRWTELVGDMPDVQSFWISGDRGGGFRGGDDLESIRVEVRGPTGPDKEEVTRQIEEMIESYDGIADAWSNAGGNRDELIIKIRPEGEELGLTQRELARQVRAAFFGEQAQRVQRERDDIRVMVRLPQEQRQSLSTLDSMRIRTPSGGEAPFRSVATAEFARARSDIDRIDGSQVVRVDAKPEDETVDVVAIARNLAPELDRLLNQHPELSWRYSGYVAEHEETKKRSMIGGTALFLALYALLAIPFRSLYQPFFVMLAVPFGAIGAMAGHVILDIVPSYLSVFGILALAGVVVNDSLVMVDFINQKTRAGENLFESVVGSGTRRFRPIFLTSATTFAGLLPILFDRSLQAQFLIPMAASLAFGILFATTITLFLIPSAYIAAEEIRGVLGRAWGWYRRPFRSDEDEDGHLPTEAGIYQEK